MGLSSIKKSIEGKVRLYEKMRGPTTVGIRGDRLSSFIMYLCITFIRFVIFFYTDFAVQSLHWLFCKKRKLKTVVCSLNKGKHVHLAKDECD